MSDQDCRATIAQFWEARQKGDRDAVRRLLAKDAHYEMAGAASLDGQVPAGRFDAATAADQFIANFPFHQVEPLTILVDGHRAAAIHRVRVSYRDGPQVASEICDLWEFDAEGKIVSLKQFADTALIGKMMAGQV